MAYYGVEIQGQPCDYFYVGIESQDHKVIAFTWNGTSLERTGDTNERPDLCPVPGHNDVPTHLLHLIPRLLILAEAEASEVGIHYRGSYQSYRITEHIGRAMGIAVVIASETECEVQAWTWGTVIINNTVPELVYDYRAPSGRTLPDGWCVDDDTMTIRDPQLVKVIQDRAIISLAQFTAKYT